VLGFPESSRPEGRGHRALYAVGATLGPRGMLGDAATDTAATAANVAEIQSTLSGALSSAQLQSTIATYTGLSAVQSQSILSIAENVANGQAPSWAELAPLVAGGLALAGVASVPVIALVAAAIPIVGALVSLITGTKAKCLWNVGGVCFAGEIPYGPSDPTWVTWADFLATPGGPVAYSEAAFPDYAATIGCELPIVDRVLASQQPGAGASDPFVGTLTPATLNVWLFLRTYYTLWESNAEQAINGHPYASDAALLAQVATAWNNTHTSGSTFTFQPATVSLSSVLVGKDGVCGQNENLADPTVPTFVSLLLAGQVDGHDEPPLTINTGPSTVAGDALAGKVTATATATAPAAASSSSSSSGATTAAVVVGGAAVAGGLAWYFLKFPFSIFGGRR
jgi:hypothetical protein